MSTSYTLHNSIKIPSIGFGTWQTPDGEIAKQAVVNAIESGYRHIDTAAIYRNELGVGEGIKESGIKRNEIFITTKVWNKARGYDLTMSSFERSIEKLDSDYIDLLLIHWPANAKQFNNWATINASTWKALETLYEQGALKAIGVSNFLPHHLKSLFVKANIKPMVNQIEYHPGFMQQDVVSFCNAENILIEAWSPLGTGKLLQNETLKTIAKFYNVSVAQLCIKWALQNNVLPLPKSVTPSRISENINVNQFTISDDDISTINKLPFIGGSGLNPDTVDF
ncbi:MAG: aldo/keto reductase [Bacteroidia bacterium]